MSFELDDRGAQEIDERAQQEGMPLGTPVEPGLFTGSGTASVKGLARGTVAKAALLLGDAATPVLKPSARAVDEQLGTSLTAWLDEQQRRNRQVLDDLKPDPQSTGFAAQVLGGLFDLGSSALLYTPEGAAVLEGYGRRQELIGQGVDETTATAVGAISGVATLVGVKAPVTLGRAAIPQGARAVARNAAYGGGVGAAAGVAERGFSQDVLTRAGYPEQAALSQPYDLTAMAADAVLGTVFSGGAAALEARASARGQAALDAALAARRARHARTETSPGIPVDPHAEGAHAAALGKALEQALHNEPVNVGDTLADAAFVRERPADKDAREELAAHVADLLPEAGATAAPAALAGATRGVRNHNPGNLEAGRDRWQGQTGSDGRFATFDTPEAGIRALARTLMTYQERHGLRSIQEVINRWAPPGENDTGAYVAAVSRAMGIEPTAALDLRDAGVLQRLATAIIHHENGAQPYPAATIRAGVDMALGRRAGTAVDAAPLPAERAVAGRESPSAPTESAARTVANTEAPLLEGRRVAESEGFEPSARRLQDDPAFSVRQPGAAREQAPAPRFPRASELQPVPVGAGVIQPREIAAGRPLYRETSVDGLSALLMDDQRPHVRSMFVTDNRDLAIGQGDNRGVQIVFREGSLSGGEHRKPGTGDVAGREYRTDLVAPRAIESFTVPAGFKPKALRGLARGALSDFTAQPHPDGSTTYVRNAPPTLDQLATGARARAEPVWAERSEAPAIPAEPAAAGGLGADPSVRAAAGVVATRPDMLVALEDGSELPAAEVLARTEDDLARAQQDARAFEAAALCFLRS